MAANVAREKTVQELALDIPSLETAEVCFDYNGQLYSVPWPEFCAGDFTVEGMAPVHEAHLWDTSMEDPSDNLTLRLNRFAWPSSAAGSGRMLVLVTIILWARRWALAVQSWPRWRFPTVRGVWCSCMFRPLFWPLRCWPAHWRWRWAWRCPASWRWACLSPVAPYAKNRCRRRKKRSGRILSMSRCGGSGPTAAVRWAARRCACL